MAIEIFFPNGISHYLIGGLFIGAAISFLFLTTGLIGGMSTLFSSIWSFFSKADYFQKDSVKSGRQWRLVYALGLVLGALVFLGIGGQGFVTDVQPWRLLTGGLLIGFGARLSMGCTAGHGICGLASLRLPSLLAVVIFLATAILTANLVHGLGVSP